MSAVYIYCRFVLMVSLSLCFIWRGQEYSCHTKKGMFVHSLSGCITQKVSFSVHVFFWYSCKVQYLRFVCFHVKHKKHALYKKIFYIRKKTNIDYILYVCVTYYKRSQKSNKKTITSYVDHFFLCLAFLLFYFMIIFKKHLFQNDC